MRNKGLCTTCANDKVCIFLRRPPLIYCEEFTDYEKGVSSAPKTRRKKAKR